jgi:nitrate/TMAO reductase-like tetraheme cytochrome c subunit
MRIRLPASVQNWISLIGLMIAIISLFIIFILFVISNFLGRGGLYLGLVTYILLPALMMAGFFLIIIGMITYTIRKKKEGKIRALGWPRIDLNLVKHRRAFFIFSGLTTLILFISALGSYEAFHFTESVPFCGRLCHTVMEPEYTAYQHTPHARVPCVECHVGPGADWYVRSKLSGLYQVYATVTDKYPRPIPTPIENLRPAREVCEICHWPEQFYDYKIRFETYYLADTENTEWDLRLIVKTGSEHPAMGLKEGIHWHINPDVKIEYIAADERREEISWVRYTDLKTRDVLVFQSDGFDLESGGMDEKEIRTMDCIDCHNRASHNYKTPSRFVNTAMVAGKISSELPDIKSLTMELCGKDYASKDEGLHTIRNDIYGYYEKNYPEILSEKRDLVDRAVGELRTLFSQNIFPKMKVRWDVHPNHIGHLDYKGCFRCHAGTLSSDKASVIGHDCNLCHVITAQGTPPNLELGDLRHPLTFKHPVDIDEAWKEMLCSECHEGAGK